MPSKLHPFGTHPTFVAPACSAASHVASMKPCQALQAQHLRLTPRSQVRLHTSKAATGVGVPAAYQKLRRKALRLSRSTLRRAYCEVLTSHCPGARPFFARAPARPSSGSAGARGSSISGRLRCGGSARGSGCSSPGGGCVRGRVGAGTIELRTLQGKAAGLETCCCLHQHQTPSYAKLRTNASRGQVREQPDEQLGSAAFSPQKSPNLAAALSQVERLCSRSNLGLGATCSPRRKACQAWGGRAASSECG